MPIAGDPQQPCLNKVLVVETKRHNSGSARRRQADDMAAAIGPGKVIVPPLCARIIEPNHLTAGRVEGMRLTPFKLVAPIASSGQIISVVPSSNSDRHNVIKRRRHTQQAMGCLAILTAMTRLGKDLLPDSLRNDGHS